MLCTDTIHDAIAAGTGFFQHGHTYMGHPVACAAAGAVLDRLTVGGLVGRVGEMGAKLRQALDTAFGQHPHVGDIRGRGLFLGLEMVADRRTKEPFDPRLKLHAKIKRAAFAEGLICYPMGGTIDGLRGDHVLLAPPFILEDTHVEEIVDKLGRALRCGPADRLKPAPGDHPMPRLASQLASRFPAGFQPHSSPGYSEPFQRLGHHF